MRKITFILFGLFVIASVISSGCAAHRTLAAKLHGSGKNAGSTEDDSAFTAREEIRQTFKFSPAANVDVSSINGSLDIETTDGNTAEVVLVRLAKAQDTLSKRKAKITYENNHLEVVGQRKESHSVWDFMSGNDELRIHATLKLPRNIELEIGGVNGKVNVGEIAGAVQVHGVNGQVKIAKAEKHLEINGINGKAEAAIAKLSNDGINIHGINGNIDLKFLDEVNANIDVHGINGRVNADLPNLKVQEQKNSNYRATLGAGGANIEVAGMNGNLSLSNAKLTAPPVKSVEVVATPEVKAAK